MFEQREIVIAIIGLIGVLVTALFSNWDKLFHKESIVQAQTSYRPTGRFETELRYYFDVSGARAAMESTQQQMMLNQRIHLLSTYPEDAERINKMLDTITKEAIGLDDVIRTLLPVYQKYFTLSEIQELNRFYSTDVMQAVLAKLPLLAQDAAPIQIKLLNDYNQRVEQLVSESN